jgi:hypothetical protein
VSSVVNLPRHVGDRRATLRVGLVEERELVRRDEIVRRELMAAT